MIYDYCVVGGGIVGLATAVALTKARPGAAILLIEKECTLGAHQTGHNSGVIHSGIYYAPGSLKADLCKRGAQAIKDFCTEHGIPFEVCGKLLVATTPLETRRLEALAERAARNGIKAERLDGEELRRREPNIIGIAGLFLESTGIVDYKCICNKMAELILEAGGTITLGAEVTAIRQTGAEVLIATAERTWTSRWLVACAGLQSDRMARLAGLNIQHKIVPFRGEYYQLSAVKSSIVKHLIYPVPNPELPFLGIHLTRMIDGSVTVGPNAVLGFSREGYGSFEFNLRDVIDYVGFPGFWKTVRSNLRSGLTETKNSLWKSGYLEECRKYCPSLTLKDLRPFRPGIRAQAVMQDGTLVHDFLVVQTDRMLHVCNAPSPAATSAIPIGEMIADKLLGPSANA